MKWTWTESRESKLAGQELFVANAAGFRLNPHMKLPGCTVVLVAFVSMAFAEDKSSPAVNQADASWQWVTFPDSRLEVRGLPWFATNSLQLWRLPKTAKEEVPKAVWNRAVAPDGGRIRLRSDTSRLAVRVQATQRPGKPCHFDAFADGEFAGAAIVRVTQVVDLMLFEKKDRVPRDIAIYL